MKPAFALLLLAFIAVSNGVAQASQFEGQRIADLQFIPPGILADSDLASAQVLRTGQPLKADDVAAAIDSLFATGRFDDIIVEAEPSADLSNPGVIVHFVTRPRWFVGGVSVTGKVVTPRNRAELASNGQFTQGSSFKEADIAYAVEGMKRLLKSNGFYEGEVTPSVERADRGQQVFITFNVTEHKRAKYAMPVMEGNRLLSDSTIVRATGWRVPLVHWWKQVTVARTRAGVQGILSRYQREDRLTAKVDLQSLEYDGETRRVTPHLNIVPGPKVKVTALETKVSKRVLNRYVPVFQEQSVDNDLLVEGKRNLESYFQSQGYFDTEVDFRVSPSNNDLETIEYVISRGNRFRVVQVSVTGNRYFDVNTIRERMFIQPTALNLRRGRYSEAFSRKDEDNISDLYKANGFRDVKVEITNERNYRGKAGSVAVTVRITEGPQWRIDKLTIAGASQAFREKLMAQIASLEGQPFAEVNLATDRNAVLTYYYQQGFPAASFEAAWQESGVPDRVEVTYTIDEGERQSVREVITSGLHTTRHSLVDKTITTRAGDPLSPVEETQIQQQLYNLGIFARVDTAIQNPDGETRQKYVLYNFEEANRYTLNVGLGAQIARFGQPSSLSLGSPGGSTGFSPEVSADVSRLNFLGLGHTVTLRTGYSSINKVASLSYQQPRFRDNAGRTVTYTVLYDNELNVRTFSSRREEASLQMSQTFSKSLTGLFRFSYRRVSVSDVVIPVLLIPQLVQPLRIGILSANLSQDRRDNPANPRRGIYNTADFGLAGRFFGSQRSFSRILLRNATYYRLSPNIVLARQTQFGLITPFAAPAALNDQQSVPLPERFFGGGADSLRAFPYNEAGPRDTGAPVVSGGPNSAPTGFPLGGNALFFNNVELRFPLLGDNIQGVFFHDMGNVFSSLSDISFRFSQANLQDLNYTVHAAGLGVRYKTPVGPVRLDLAYSINPPAFDGFSGTPQQLLQCNPNAAPGTLPGFCQPSRQNVSHFQFFFSIGQTF